MDSLTFGTVTIYAPEASALRGLWNLAVSKFGVRTGREVTTADDYLEFLEDYMALTRKERGSLSAVIKEICDKAPGGD